MTIRRISLQICNLKQDILRLNIFKTQNRSNKVSIFIQLLNFDQYILLFNQQRGNKCCLNTVDLLIIPRYRDRTVSVTNL